MDIRLMAAVLFVDLTAPEDVLCRTIFCLHVRPHHADVRFNFLSFNMSDPAPDIQRIYSVCVCVAGCRGFADELRSWHADAQDDRKEVAVAAAGSLRL